MRQNELRASVSKYMSKQKIPQKISGFEFPKIVRRRIATAAQQNIFHFNGKLEHVHKCYGECFDAHFYESRHLSKHRN